MESLAREAAVFAAAGDHPNCQGARPGRLSTLLSISYGASLSYGRSLFAKAAAGSGRLATVSGDLRPRAVIAFHSWCPAAPQFLLTALAAHGGRLRRGSSVTCPPHSLLYGESLYMQHIPVTNDSAPSYIHRPRRVRGPPAAAARAQAGGGRAVGCRPVVHVPS